MIEGAEVGSGADACGAEVDLAAGIPIFTKEGDAAMEVADDEEGTSVSPISLVSPVSPVSVVPPSFPPILFAAGSFVIFVVDREGGTPDPSLGTI